ncbi:MAG: hypothetical protein GXY33_08330 [Phycisphaerae bacterium]|nr:hypothetical protein [Phycisphaerae bacterium]
MRSLKDLLRRKQRQVQQHQLRIKQLEEQLAAKRDEIKHRQSRTGQLELEFKAREEAVNKLRTQLNAAKSNKEYSAILTQLNTDRADNSKLEERILNELTAVDEMKKGLGELEKQLGEHAGQLAQQESHFEAERSGLQQQIDELEQQRSSMADSVTPGDLAVFQRVADRHDGEAMAKITKPYPNADEYICDGCNMSIPMETVNALLTRDEIQVCHVCGRILFLEDAVRKEN